MKPLTKLLPVMLALLAASASQSSGGAESPAGQLSSLSRHLDVAASRLKSSDRRGAQNEFKAFEEGWAIIEDGIRERSKAHYRAIEEAMADVDYLLDAEPLDAAKAKAAVEELRARTQSFIRGEPIPATQATASKAKEVTVKTLVARLDKAVAKLEAGDSSGAAAEIGAFRREWTEVEGLVKAKSSQAYSATENNMAKAYALLTQNQPDRAEARAVLRQMKADLIPYAGGETRYGIFDAALILLREGFEAILVVAALLAFLAQTKHADKRPWIWGGSAAGVLVSILIAFAVNLAFSHAEAGFNRELLEGLTGLLAAAMLIYVGYWLHSKTSLSAWHHYINSQTTSALNKNSLLSLALIAFLAVFREGAETILFYAGIAPSIDLGDLIWGLALGAAGLSLVGLLVLTFGMRLPVKPFFLGASVLLYYLAFKFVGTGIHALQVAGALAATPAEHLPHSDFFGIFPTWETTVAQAAILLAAVTVLFASRLRASAHGSEIRS